jgi:hypothetical protein
MSRRFDPNILTYDELDAVLHAVGQMTGGNANDIDEMMLCGMTLKEAEALLRAEAKLMGSVIKQKVA